MKYPREIFGSASSVSRHLACLGDLVASPAAREETEVLLLLPRLIAELPEPYRRVIVLRIFHDQLLDS